jgi:hypothetical protein
LGKQGKPTPDAIRKFVIRSKKKALSLTQREIAAMVQVEYGEGAGIDKSTVGRILRSATPEWSRPASTDTDDVEPRPQLYVSLEGLRSVTSHATILLEGGYRPIGQARQPTQPVTVKAYSFRVSSKGRGAAEHVAGTLEFDSMARRICWVEGNVPYLNINEDDYAYLDVYGVILNPQNSPTTDIVMPTEHGWDNLYPRTLTAPLEVSLRVTAANARPQTIRFSIDPTQGCKPIGG